MTSGKGRILISDLGSGVWRDIGVGEVTISGPEFEPGDAYYLDSSGTIRSTSTSEEFRECYFCSGRGRRKLRRRSRRRGRYGACPNCEGRGGRWFRFDGPPSSFTFVIDEVRGMDTDLLKKLFQGDAE